MNWVSYKWKFLIYIGISLLGVVLLIFLIIFWVLVRIVFYLVFLFFGIFIVVVNFDYLVSFLKGNLKLGGFIFLYIGFGLMIVGIIVFGLNKCYIFLNFFVMEGMIEGVEDDIV